MVSNEFKVSPDDFVAWCPAHWTLLELQLKLAESNLMIPILGSWNSDQSLEESTNHLVKLSYLEDQSLADQIGWNWPHFCQSNHGSWVHWMLGATLELADGSIVKSGSSVTKSVAGFDAHKLLIGSKGTLMTPKLIVLRVIPISGLRVPKLTITNQNPEQKLTHVERVNRNDFNQMVNSLKETTILHDPGNCTFWHSINTSDRSMKLDSRRWIELCKGENRLDVAVATKNALIRAKQLLDPENKLGNGGIFDE